MPRKPDAKDDYFFDPPSFDAADILDIEPEPPQYIIPGLAIEPGPVTLFSALTNRGKTLLLTHTALSVATGSLILGRLPTVKGKVVWIDGELGLRKYRDNYCRRVLKGAPELVPEADMFTACSWFGDPSIPDLNDPHDLDRIARLMDGRSLCIIDSLRRFHSGDEIGSENAEVLVQLGGISAKTGCAAIVIHHHRKPGINGRGDGEFSMRGTIAFADVADSAYRISRNTKTETLKLHQDKSRAAERMKPISYRMEGCGRYLREGLGYEGVRFIVVDEKEAEADKNDDIPTIIKNVLSSSPAAVARTKLVEMVGRRADDVREAIDVMTEAGDIIEEKHGRSLLYRLPDDIEKAA